MLNRKKSGSMVCPSCGRLISVTAKECIHCGRKNPGLWGFGPAFKQTFGRSIDPVMLIIAASVLIYLIAILIDPSALLRPRGVFSFLSPSMGALDRLGMTGKYALQQGRWWTLITAIYLHGGILHILFNMLWLRQLGETVGYLFGNSRMFLIFTIAGMIGFLLSDCFSINFTVGASGSIFGLLGALIYYGRRRGGVFGAAVYRQVGSWALVLFIFGFLMPGVNNIAHLGGFLGGYLSAQFLSFQELKPENNNHRSLALVATAVTLLCFLAAIIFPSRF